MWWLTIKTHVSHARIYKETFLKLRSYRIAKDFALMPVYHRFQSVFLQATFDIDNIAAETVDIRFSFDLSIALGVDPRSIIKISEITDEKPS